MTRGFKIFLLLLLLLLHTFAHQQFPFLPVLAFTHRIPIPYYLSILSIYHCLLLWKQSETSLDSSIQLVPRKYIISYTHSIAITLIHHSSSSQFLFFLHTPRRIQDSKILCIYIHTLHYASCCGFAVDTFPPFFLFSFSFLLIRLSFSILESFWIIEIVMSFCFLHQNKTVISAGKP